MEDNIYYSPSNNSFFAESLIEAYKDSSEGFPEDCLLISQERYKELFKGQREGYIIVKGKDNLPILEKQVPKEPSLDNQRLVRLKEADDIIQPLVGYVVAGVASEEDITKLKLWSTYRKSLEEVNLEGSDFTWPAKPEE